MTTGATIVPGKCIDGFATNVEIPDVSITTNPPDEIETNAPRLTLFNSDTPTTLPVAAEKEPDVSTESSLRRRKSTELLSPQAI